MFFFFSSNKMFSIFRSLEEKEKSCKKIINTNLEGNRKKEDIGKVRWLGRVKTFAVIETLHVETRRF